MTRKDYLHNIDTIDPNEKKNENRGYCISLSLCRWQFSFMLCIVQMHNVNSFPYTHYEEEWEGDKVVIWRKQFNRIEVEGKKFLLHTFFTFRFATYLVWDRIKAAANTFHSNTVWWLGALNPQSDTSPWYFRENLEDFLFCVLRPMPLSLPLRWTCAYMNPRSASRVKDSKVSTRETWNLDTDSRFWVGVKTLLLFDQFSFLKRSRLRKFLSS